MILSLRDIDEDGEMATLTCHRSKEMSVVLSTLLVEELKIVK